MRALLLSALLLASCASRAPIIYSMRPSRADVLLWTGKISIEDHRDLIMTSPWGRMDSNGVKYWRSDYMPNWQNIGHPVTDDPMGVDW